MRGKGSKVIEFKRMLRQYEYSLEDLHDLKELSNEINVEFNSAIAALKRADLFDNKKIEAAAEEADIEEIIPEERDPNFKKLFRKIVVACHPDRFDDSITERDKIFRTDMYDRAIKANDAYSWAELITVAIKLEIDLPEEYYEYVENLKSDSDKVQEEINAIQNSVSWTWYHASEEQRQVILQQYVKHLEKMVHGSKLPPIRILGVGHPRTGTGFTAWLLKSWGLNVGHEKLESDGIVAWQFAVEDGPWPFIEGVEFRPKWENLIYNVRDPKTSIASIAFTENATLPYRIESGGALKSPNPVEQAIHSILRWDQLITRMKPDLTYRIEDEAPKLFEFLKSKGFEVNWIEPQSGINARQHATISDLEKEMQSVRPSLRMKINSYCIKYGYDPLF